MQSGLVEDGSVNCLHGQVAIRLQAKTDANRGRWFYKCNNQEAPCKFFKWEDQLLPGNSPNPGSQSSSRPGPSTPQALSRFGNDSGRTLGSPPTQTSPSKRPAEPTEDEDEEYWSAEGNAETGGPSPLKKFKFAPPPKPQQTPGRSTWQSIQEDPDNPFHVTASNIRGLPDTPSGISTAPASTYNTPSHPNQSQEASTSELRAAVELFSGIPDRIERLERKLLAAERSSAHKARRIGELEEENKKLKDELLDKMRKAEVLESTIDALRAAR
ncbi:hypothetical protein CALVIDRAFT_534839 [Calocera viscosa TUFC12733]|uniref:GRF-type domain-containing protein n=1 Tax=Calocera viscosa (strain TUFC12733) TaxID=1330018 RepID=A0A167PGA7_CALVF|nr:hypothetical protein CALVIDRAFT_534839 [Calocera viscosa TUFC12733]